MNIILIALGVLIIGYLVFIYNKLVRLKNLSEEAWSGIDVQLQKRHDLIPLIVETVSGYAKHEKALFERITQLRALGQQAGTIQELETAEIGLSKALGDLFIVVENYPELKANENFLELQKELSKVEHDLQRARRYYNGSVRNYNIVNQQFPSNLIAATFGHKSREYFDIKDETEKSAPVINL